MWILIISISVALVAALVVSKLSPDKEPKKEAPPSDCCGAHEVCDKESLLAHAHGDVVYYNDEELDEFKGKSPDLYTSEETEQFREVLTTMHHSEVSGWLRSLMVRGIKLPPNVREEALHIVRAQRA